MYVEIVLHKPHTCRHVHTRTHARTQARAHRRAHTRAHTHTHARTHAGTHNSHTRTGARGTHAMYASVRTQITCGADLRLVRCERWLYAASVVLTTHRVTRLRHAMLYAASAVLTTHRVTRLRHAMLYAASVGCDVLTTHRVTRLRHAISSSAAASSALIPAASPRCFFFFGPAGSAPSSCGMHARSNASPTRRRAAASPTLSCAERSGASRVRRLGRSGRARLVAAVGVVRVGHGDDAFGEQPLRRVGVVRVQRRLRSGVAAAG
jgi:hypothetical protein